MDRTNIIRNRIADLRSEKYTYLKNYLKEGEYEYPYSTAAGEWEDLLSYLENNIQTEKVEYNVAEEQEVVDFATIYTGESLRKYIDNIPEPGSGADKVMSELSEYINCTAEYYLDWAPVQESICYLHDNLSSPALPVIAKYIREHGEEELYRSALIVLDYEKILKTCIEGQDGYAEHKIYFTLMLRLENLKYCGYDRIYLYDIGVLRKVFVQEFLLDNIKIPYTYLGVRIVMSGRLSYFAEYILRQRNRYADKTPYGYVLYPPRLEKYCKVSNIKDLPQLTPEEVKRVEDIVRFTAEEVFYTDELLTYQSQTDPLWNRLLEYDTRLKYNTTKSRTWKCPEWMVQLIEFYILLALRSICDTQEDIERIERYKGAVLVCLPEPFQDKTFTEDPCAEDSIFDLILSTGIFGATWNSEEKRFVCWINVSEIAAYYLHLDKYRPV